MARLVVILHSGSLSAGRADEADTLVQTKELSALLAALGWEVKTVSYELGEAAVTTILQGLEPDVVVNLVESVFGSDEQSYRATQLLDQLGLPYTGAATHCLRRCSSKPRLKRMLTEAGIPTPHWARYDGSKTPHLPTGRYIVKSETEHGSLGLDSTSVVEAADVWFSITHLANRHGGAWFAEQYIDGREFNVALLADGERVDVLPIAEIAFDGLPSTLPRIVDYAAKWDEASLTYRHSQRRFPTLDAGLQARLTDTALRCWHACALKGYARVDFRMAADGTPYVIDVNPNPCLSADAGFLASAAQAELSTQHVLQRILDDALLPHDQRRPPFAVMG